MSAYLPDGCTDFDVDWAAGGYDEPEPEDPENLTTSEPVPTPACELTDEECPF